MKYTKFTDSEKIKLFDEIASHFYEVNFGQMSKSDFELLMFSIYLDKMIEENKNSDETIDYNLCSDYKISKELGITQQRVRNLKVKKQLIYPIKFDWEKALAKLIENARYDKPTQKIILNIPDPNLYLEIQNFIEENGSYIEKQLNSKVLKIRVENFIELALTLEDDKTKKEIIKKFNKALHNTNKEEEFFDEIGLGKFLKSNSDYISVFCNVINGLSSVKGVMTALIKKI